MPRFRASAISALIALLGLALPAQAAPILYSVSSLDDGLSTINPETGEVSFVGRLSPPGPSLYSTPVALAAHPETGVLYTWNNSGLDGPGLLTISPSTGRATRVSPIGLAPSVEFGAIAFASDGTLFALGQHIAVVSLETGLPQLISSTRFLPTFAGADFSSNGTLYAAMLSGLLFVDFDLETGTWGRALPLLFGDGSSFASGDYVGSIVFGPGGTLFGSAYLLAGAKTETGVILNPRSEVLFEIDLETGAMSNFVEIGAIHIPQGLAFVPEPTAVVLFAAALAGLALLRRRQT
jgi:hypothetical protein